jgi:predicted phosphoribosyltransferase
VRAFRDRRDAGRELAPLVRDVAGDDPLVLALPRGGVPVAFEVAEALDAPLDVFVVRKLGVPGHEELAMGAIAAGGDPVLYAPVLSSLDIDDATIERVVQRETAELRRRDEAYRGDEPAPDVAGRTVVVVDDGLATGSSMRAAVKALRQRHPARIIVAVPVASHSTCALLETEADDVVCAAFPQPFYAVGQGYVDFSQTSDDEVRTLLAEARRRRATS